MRARADQREMQTPLSALPLLHELLGFRLRGVIPFPVDSEQGQGVSLHARRPWHADTGGQRTPINREQAAPCQGLFRMLLPKVRAIFFFKKLVLGIAPELMVSLAY